MAQHVLIKRVYDKQESSDEYRVLVDRLWPRGVKKDELQYDAWVKDLAPSPPLRKWFGHKPENWVHFRESYEDELREASQMERMRALVDEAGRKRMTLVYAAKDPDHNHALILAKELDRLY